MHSVLTGAHPDHFSVFLELSLYSNQKGYRGPSLLPQGIKEQV